MPTEKIQHNTDLSQAEAKAVAWASREGEELKFFSQITEILTFLKQHNLPGGESIWREEDWTTLVLQTIRDLLTNLEQVEENHQNEIYNLEEQLGDLQEKLEKLEFDHNDLEDLLEATDKKLKEILKATDKKLKETQEKLEALEESPYSQEERRF